MVSQFSYGSGHFVERVGGRLEGRGSVTAWFRPRNPPRTKSTAVSAQDAVPIQLADTRVRRQAKVPPSSIEAHDDGTYVQAEARLALG
ncbi:hypothetical protein SAMN04489740_3867 [Arthrobacter alpinus]|uniref:Uncharacterized protein n=1 Tax=Arthrobacter alpinus TaxID=656366 RepID=A0A1H5NQJ4_9MICC|nr:hypothetical protein SAMN04489740_3867 [Arthrobacter alpinus]